MLKRWRSNAPPGERWRKKTLFVSPPVALQVESSLQRLALGKRRILRSVMYEVLHLFSYRRLDLVF